MNLQDKIDKAIRTIPDFPKPGIQYKDISTLFLQPELVNEIIKQTVEMLSGKGIEAIAGIESRGFLLGVPIAAGLGVPFIMIRKAGKLPAKTFSETYDLEYGSATIEMHCDALEPGMRVAIVDDVLATGGTAIAAVKLIVKAKAVPVICYFIAELGFLPGKDKLEKMNMDVFSTIKYS